MRNTDSRLCARCGEVTPRYKNGHCRPCSLSYAKDYADTHQKERKAYVAANREKNAAASRSWYWRNRDKASEKAKRYYADNRERLRAINKKWREANPERRKATFDAFYRENADAQRERSRRWKRENPDKVAAINHRRRVRISRAKENFTAAEWIQLKRQYDNRCLCCGRSDIELTIDHVLPLSMEGSNSISNIQPLCKSCNSSKKDRYIDYR